MKQLYLKTLGLCLFALAAISTYAQNATEQIHDNYGMSRPPKAAMVSVDAITQERSTDSKAMAKRKAQEQTTFFAENTIEGIEMWFSVISEEEKTCRVGGAVPDKEGYYYIAIPENTTGKVSIPATANGYKVVEIETIAFYNLEGITEVIIPEGVTRIGNSSFYKCWGLTNITIPNSVISIEDYAFYNCYKPKSITIPEGVTTIGNGAFELCQGFSSGIIIPNSVTSIGDNAFRNCIYLKSVTIPSVTKMGKNAFYGCKFLRDVSIRIIDAVSFCNNGGAGFVCSQISTWETKSVKLIAINGNEITAFRIPESVTKISDGAFAYCSGIEIIIIPNSVTMIGDKAFCSCSSLNNITTHNNLTSIGDSAFVDCSSLTSIIIPNNVTSIGESAFSGCKNLTSITIPSTVTNFGDNAFLGCEKLKDITVVVVDFADFCNNGGTAFVRTQSLSYKYPIYYKKPIKLIDINGNEIKEFVVPESVTTIGDNVFYYCEGLTSIIIPSSVTSIGESAFYECSALKSIDIPNGLTSISNETFYGCNNLTSFTIPNSVTSIGCSAFKFCHGLTSITIPNSVTNIGDEAFYACENLQNFTISNSVASIGKDAFGSCFAVTLIKVCVVDFEDLYSNRGTSFLHGCGLTLRYLIKLIDVNGIEIKEIVIPENVTSICSSAFEYCSGLTSITIPSSVTSIGSSAFYGCSGLTSITIPNNVTRIGNLTFENCSGLTSINIPSSVTSIGSSAFYGCSGLTSINIPYNVTSIGDWAFAKCSSLTDIRSDILEPFAITDNVFSDETYKSAILSIPYGTKRLYRATDGWKNFKKIDSGEIFEGDEFTEMTAEGIMMTFKVISIEKMTCQVGNGEERAISQDVSGLVTIPHVVKGFSVIDISSSAFSWGSGVTSIAIPNSVTSIGGGAFYWCSSLTSITIPNSVTSIGEMAFIGCSGLTSITIPTSVTSIGEKAFSDCSGLTSISIPNGVTSIGEGTFSMCSGVTSINIPNSVTSIGEEAFYGCSGLTSITISNSVTSIGEKAFSGCSGLTSITLPNSVTNIGEGTFSGCSGLTSINIPNSVTSIGEEAFYNTGMYNNSPDGVFYIGQWACGYKGEMPIFTSLILKDGTKGIADGFCKSNSNLWKITIPNSVKIIGDEAFLGSRLIDVYSQIEEPFYIAESVFGSEIYNRAVLHVPMGTKGKYQYSGGWCHFQNIDDPLLSVSEAIAKVKSLSVGEITSDYYYIKGKGDCLAFFTSQFYCDGYLKDEEDGSILRTGGIYYLNYEVPTEYMLLDGDDIIIYARLKHGSNLLNGNINAVAVDGCIYSVNGSKGSLVKGDLFVDFSPNGDELVFSVVDVSEKTCQVGGKNPQKTNDYYYGVEKSYKGKLTIPEETRGYKVIGVDKQAFLNHDELTEVSIPNAVTYINESAFEGCRKLTSFRIPASLQRIGNDAFSISGTEFQKVIVSDLSSWFKINFGNEHSNPLSAAGKLYDNDNKEIVNVVVPNGLERINKYAFCGGKNIQSVSIPSSIVSIGADAFSGCGSLKKVIVPDIKAWCGVKFVIGDNYDSPTTSNPLSIAHHLYSNESTEVKDLVIPDGVKTIGASAFFGCSGLTSVTIPGSVKTIDNYSFEGCTNLSKTIVPDIASWCGIMFLDNPLRISRHLYSDKDTEVKELKIPSGVNSISDRAFFACSGLTSVSMPNSLESIGTDAFSCCSGIKSLVIPNGVETIGEHAFDACESMETLVIPNSMKSIGAYAFADCLNLYSVTSLINMPFILNETAFRYSGTIYPKDVIYMNAKLYVPKGKMSMYMLTDGWQKFINVLETDTKFKLTYMLNGAEYKTYEIQAAEVITPEPDPYKEGYIFSGWSAIPDVMPAEDVMVFGRLTVDPDYNGVAGVTNDETTPTAYYSIDGQRHDTQKKGLNIIRMSDGTVRKVMAK